MLRLNLPSYEYSVREVDERLQIYDLVRKKYVALSPEEWVRQHFLNYLMAHMKVPAGFIRLEGKHRYNSLSKRSDILVFSDTLKPLLLVECKASHIGISPDTLMQLSVYNINIKAAFLAVTNGLSHIYWKKDQVAEGYTKIQELPEYKEMALSAEFPV
jgi:hypothetical protein